MYKIQDVWTRWQSRYVAIVQVQNCLNPLGIGLRDSAQKMSFYIASTNC